MKKYQYHIVFNYYFVPGYILYPGFMPRRILRLAENTNDRNHRM